MVLLVCWRVGGIACVNRKPQRKFPQFSETTDLPVNLTLKLNTLLQWSIISVGVKTCGRTSNISSDIRPENVPDSTSKDFEIGANPYRLYNVPSIQTVAFGTRVIAKQIQLLEAGRTTEQLVDLLACEERHAVHAQDLQSRGVEEERVERLEPIVEITVIVLVRFEDNSLQPLWRRGQVEESGKFLI